MGTPSTYSMTKYGRPLVGGPAVQQPGDVGVLEAGQDLALVLEALQQEGGIGARGGSP